MLQLQFEGFFFGDRNRLADDPFSAEFTHDGRVFGAKQLFQQRAFLFPAASNAINEIFLGAIIERDITGGGGAAKDTDFPHPLRADAADRKVGHTAIGKTQARISDVLGAAEHGDADGIDAGNR